MFLQECDPDSFEEDPDGIAIAESINAHLPSVVRVFSVQRVTKKFDARRECTRRTYVYHLPASLLGLKGDGGAEDAETLRLLTAAWRSFEGHHPFHNYTKRRLYRETNQSPYAGGRRTNRRRNEDEEESSSGDEDVEVGGDGDGGSVSVSLDGSSGDGNGASAAATGTDAQSNEAPFTEHAFATTPQEQQQQQAQQQKEELTEHEKLRRGKLNLLWKDEKDEADPIVRRHFRFMENCQVEDTLIRLSPNGEPCVRLTVRGASFMLHQIRHMVGAAMAVALRRLPLDGLQASLVTPARVALPLAPPSTLMLLDAEFSRFRSSWDGKAALVTQWSGDRLELREPGQALKERFANEVLYPAMSELLSGAEWQEWKVDLDRIWYAEEDMKNWIRSAREWEERKAMKRAARTEALLEEAAAKFNNIDES